MIEVSRYIFLAGALVFVVLGVAHVLVTPRRIDQDKGLSPRNPTLRAAMAGDTILLTRRTSIWLAWVGFNLSHGLGLVLFGAVNLLVGRSLASFLGQAGVLLPFAVAVSGLYMMLALRYWFRTPIIGIAVGCACFIASWALLIIGD